MNKQDWTYKKLGDICKVLNGLWVGKKEPFVNIAVIGGYLVGPTAGIGGALDKKSTTFFIKHYSTTKPAPL